MQRALALGCLLAACASASQAPAPAPAPDSSTANARPASSPPTADPALERRIARLELRLLEKQTQLEDLQARLDEARREVVRAMARLQTAATRAEAASAMAEAELALQAAPDQVQGRHLLDMSAAEFNRDNYGGALYLANQAKSLAALRTRLPSGARGELRPGEVLFALPLRLAVVGTSNVRDGPALSFRVLFTLERGAPVVGHSFVDDWVRITDATGRSGWIFHGLVGRP